MLYFNKLSEFLRLNKDTPVKISIVSYENPKLNKEIYLDTCQFSLSNDFINMDTIIIAIKNIANFYPISDWGGSMRVALQTDIDNPYNEINLTAQAEIEGVNQPFKLTRYIKNLM